MHINDKWIELIKWFISSVCVVTVTLIIDTGFKEREAGIKEIEVYDKYVDIILQADNIEQRWKLCEYFSIVTPTERLRQRWQAYKDVISKDYKDWKSKKDSCLGNSNDKPLVGSSDLKTALEFETEGFQYILDRDIDKSLSSFKSAEYYKPGLHNCYEIYKYLIKHKSELLNKQSNKWNDLQSKLLEDWSWGLPENIKNTLTKLK